MKNKHPKDYCFCSLLKCGERFGYYLIIGIFVLYMIDPTSYWRVLFDKYTDEYFGTHYVNLFNSVLGGYLADEFLGYFKAIYLWWLW